MTENQARMNQLLEKLEALSNRQEMFLKEINELRGEISNLKASEVQEVLPEQPEVEPVKTVQEIIAEIRGGNDTAIKQTVPPKVMETPKYSSVQTQKPPKVSFNLEKFIGENLINKIGIAITVIGVAIGAKYSIDHQLISPLTRILLGYLMGFGLLGVGLKLKKNYESYSAVLVSGAMAIMYFITYFAYSFYQLMPQAMVFALMVIITVFTVVAALKYNRQVIAHIGLVGAYAVPFLLSDGSGNVKILYSYMAIINIGILVISFIKYWKSLYYASFLLTWLIYFSWYNLNYRADDHFGLALTFLTIFFLLFYATFLAYKLRKNEKFGTEDIFLLLANSFIFYGIGYSILDNHEIWKQFIGIYTIGNALIHLIVCAIIYRKKLADRNLFYFVLGLGLVFITIAIPVQLDGNWVTLLWIGETALLFWIGRTKNNPAYEILSYPLMLLSFLSIQQDWATGYQNSTYIQSSEITPLLNINFLTSMLFIAAFWFMTVLNQDRNYTSPLFARKRLMKIVSFSIPAIFLYALYFSFRMEINSWFHQLYSHSEIVINKEGQNPPDFYYNSDLLKFKTICISIYSMLFFSLLSMVNIKKIRNQQLGFINLSLNMMVIGVFLIQDLFILSQLRESYLTQELSQYYQRGILNIGIRYISLTFFALTLVTTYKYIRQEFLKINYERNFDLLLHLSALWVLSAELINWMNIAGSDQSYKLGLSILWGVYALFLISVGIWKKKKHLRIAAIVLFAVTLTKLFTYDISHLDTISKTIVLVILGILLLTISFLYNKYKHIISD